MNIILQLILPIICTSFVILVAIGRINVIWFPKKQKSIDIAEIVAPTFEKPRRGRPCKGKTHYLHLPNNASQNDLHSAINFFKKYEDKYGDKVVLYVVQNEVEQSFEVPYRVRWDETVKDSFMKHLGGWS
jgi:hypothetical protein